MCFAPDVKTPAVPPPPPPPPPPPEPTARRARTPERTLQGQRVAARLGAQQLRIPLNTVQIPR